MRLEIGVVLATEDAEDHEKTLDVCSAEFAEDVEDGEKSEAAERAERSEDSGGEIGRAHV